MPMLMPNPNTISKSLQNITKTGINLDEIVRHSIKCDVKSTLKKRTNHAQPVTSSSVLKSKAKLLLQENNKSKIARNNTSIPPVVNGTGKIQRSKLDSERPYQNRTKSYMTKRYPLNDMNFCQNVVKKEQFESKAALTPTTPQDDSLTSLQWLTGVKVNDILEGKPIQYSSPPSPATSTSSDELTDEKSFIRRESRYYSVDYRQNHEIKPPYSYAALIIMAMKSKGCGKMTLSEIYKWISDNFLYYRNAEPTWQNSIRHNLSLNKCFAKIPRKKGDPGKGGYWSIVPEFANKLLENSIRKRRSNIYDYEHADSAKRQRLDILESQLLCKLKSEFKHDPCSRPEDENPMLLQQHQQQQQQQQHHHHLQQQKSYLEHLPVVTPSPPPLHPLEQASPVEIIADMEHCRMDHPYGKSPVVNYNVSDEENIRAIASHLEETTSNVGAEDSIIHIPPNNSIFNTFSSAIRTDCIWSSEQHLAESMGHVTNELLEAQELDEHAENGFLKQLNNSLNNSLNSNSSGLAPALFCLSPPISGDDDRYSDDRYSDNISDNIDDLDNQNDVEYEEEDEEFKYLRVRGTSMTLFEPTPEMIHISTHKIKEEPLSPNSIDLNE